MSSPNAAPPLDVEVRPGRTPLLLVDRPADAVDWAARWRDALRGTVARHGAVLVRGLGLGDAAQVAQVFERLGSGLMVEREAFAERQRYTDGVYSSAKWPANQPMCMHHELSYTLEAPSLMLFACLTAPQSGGVTGVADASAVAADLPQELLKRFAHEGWMLVRSYNDEIGASWQEAFGTEDRSVVEAYCRANGIAADWRADGTLRTRQRRAAVVRHPVSGRVCWFNQVAFLNEWTMDPDVHEYLVDVYGAEGLPFNTRFGGGDAIGQDVVDLLNRVYESRTLREPWQAGDLMLVDNIATAHSREPYTGQREVLVGMTGPVRMPVPAGPAR